ncbi:MAG: flagellar export chaperone FliS [Enterobacteriaceae bacterium]
MYGDSVEGYEQYHQSELATQVAAATPHQLVLILFNGLMDELVRVKGHIEAKRYERKAQSINKCIDILNALSSALDYDKGGELAKTLAGLYDFSVHRLYEASNKLSVEMVQEVEQVLGNIRQGWEGMGKGAVPGSEGR